MDIQDIIARLQSAAVHFDNAWEDLNKVLEGTRGQTDQNTTDYLDAIAENTRELWTATATLGTEASEQAESHAHHHHEAAA